MGEQEQHICLLHDSSAPDLVKDLTQEQEVGTWLVTSENHHLGKMEAQQVVEPEKEVIKWIRKGTRTTKLMQDMHIVLL